MCPRTLSPAKRDESMPLTSAVPRSVGTASVCPNSLFEKLVDGEASPRHGPDFAEILRIPVAKSVPAVAVHAAGHDWNLRGPTPSRALPASYEAESHPAALALPRMRACGLPRPVFPAGWNDFQRGIFAYFHMIDAVSLSPPLPAVTPSKANRVLLAYKTSFGFQATLLSVPGSTSA